MSSEEKLNRIALMNLVMFLMLILGIVILQIIDPDNRLFVSHNSIHQEIVEGVGK